MLSLGVQVHTPYGATEALPVSSIGSEAIIKETSLRTPLGAGVCVGHPVPGMRVRIIRIRDEPIPNWTEDLVAPPGEIGEIVVQGPVVTSSYYQRPESTAMAKIQPPAGEGTIHRMGDLGYLDDCGRIWFCGRKSQRVVTAKGTFFTIPCEGVFNAHPAVYRTALVGVPRGGDLEPVLCVEREKSASAIPEAQLCQELLALGAAQAHTRAVQTILFHDRFPVDVRHNAKIFREKLAIWAARRLR
jgi:acyl-CoA synthetase (AMP-forming)/AMP-acid ligase II